MHKTLIGRRSSAYQSASDWVTISEDEEEDANEDEESDNLDWDPIDGMHAEKQRRVQDLKQFFETNKRRSSIRQRLQLRSPSPSPSTKIKM